MAGQCILFPGPICLLPGFHCIACCPSGKHTFSVISGMPSLLPMTRDRFAARLSPPKAHKHMASPMLPETHAGPMKQRASRDAYQKQAYQYLTERTPHRMRPQRAVPHRYCKTTSASVDSGQVSLSAECCPREPSS